MIILVIGLGEGCECIGRNMKIMVAAAVFCAFNAAASYRWLNKQSYRTR